MRLTALDKYRGAAITVALVVGCAGPLTLAATSVTLTDETTCPGGGLGVVRALVNTDGAPLGSAELSVLFDDALLEIAGVFATGFSATDYALAWSVVGDPVGLDALEITLSTGTPSIPAADEELVWIAVRSTGPAGIHPLAWNPTATLIDGVAPDTLQDGSLNGVTADVAIRIPQDLTSEPGKVFEAPVVADVADGLSSFDLTVEYDPGVARFLDAQTTATTAGFFIVSNVLQPGEVSIALFDLSGGSIPPGTGSAAVASLSFNVDRPAGSGTPLDLTRAITDDGVVTCSDDGLLSVCADGDDDGYSVCADCDDMDPDVYPGAPELCDGKDNQCPGDAGFGTVDEGFDPDGDLLASCVDNCPDLANADQADLDADGAGDVCDCAPADPANPVAPDVGNSVIAGRTGTTVDLTWDDQGLQGEFLLYRGSRDVDGPFAYNHACAGPPLAAPMVSDADVPANGQIFTYLLSRRNDCGESGLGDGLGVPRPNDAPCP